MSTSDLNLDLPNIQDGCLAIEFMIGTPEAWMPDIGNLSKEISQPNRSYRCRLNHFSISNKEVQALL